MFPVLVRLAHSSPSTVLQRQSLLILRNLAFSSTHKARIVAEGSTRSQRSDTSVFPCRLAKYIPTIMSHVVSKTSDTAYIGLTALWALIVDAQKVIEQRRESRWFSNLLSGQSRRAKQQCLACLVRCEDTAAKQRESPMLPRCLECYSNVNRRLASLLCCSQYS